MCLPKIYCSSFPCYLPLLALISLSAPYYESRHNTQFLTLCYLPLLAPDITLSTLLTVSPQYTVLHSCLPSHFGTRYHSQNPIMSLRTIYSSSPSVTFPFWIHISLSAPYYESPHNIQFFIPVLHSTFGARYHSQHPIIILPTI